MADPLQSIQPTSRFLLLVSSKSQMCVLLKSDVHGKINLSPAARFIRRFSDVSPKAAADIACHPSIVWLFFQSGFRYA